MQQPDLAIEPLDKSIAPTFADFIPVTVREVPKQAPKPEQNCILHLNDHLRMQIPSEVMNSDFLQMLLIASGVR